MSKRKPPGYWTANKIKAEAKRFTNRRDWKRNGAGSYGAASKLGILDQCSEHMEILQGFWTFENLMADARKYVSLKEWRAASASAYVTAKKKGYLSECTQHMQRDRRPAGYWTKKKCREIAEQYLTIKEWSINDGASYDFAKRSGWIEDVTKHMVTTTSVGEVTIYQLLLRHDIDFEFQKRFPDLRLKKQLPFDFYIPSFNLVIEYQGRQHFKVSKSSMYKKDIAAIQKRDQFKRDYATRTGLNYLEIADENPSDIEAAIKSKVCKLGYVWPETTRDLKKNEIERLATLGVWDKESVIAEARKYKTLMEWRYCGNASEQIARKRGWFEEATAHMTSGNTKWTLALVRASAAKYSSRGEWAKCDQRAYAAAQWHNWLDQVCGHMKPAKPKKSRMRWTPEAIIQNAKNYSSISEWRASPNNGYRYAREHGVFEEATSHMKQLQTPPNFWTRKKIIEDARKFDSKAAWRNSNNGSYRKAQKSGWLDEIVPMCGFG